MDERTVSGLAKWKIGSRRGSHREVLLKGSLKKYQAKNNTKIAN